MSFGFSAQKTATAHKPTHIRPPIVVHHAAKKNKQLQATKSAELYVNNLSIRFPVGVNDANIRDTAATLFATMQRVDTGLVLLSLKKEQS